MAEFEEFININECVPIAEEMSDAELLGIAVNLDMILILSLTNNTYQKWKFVQESAIL